MGDRYETSVFHQKITECFGGMEENEYFCTEIQTLKFPPITLVWIREGGYKTAFRYFQTSIWVST